MSSVFEISTSSLMCLSSSQEYKYHTDVKAKLQFEITYATQQFNKLPHAIQSTLE